MGLSGGSIKPSLVRPTQWLFFPVLVHNKYYFFILLETWIPLVSYTAKPRRVAAAHEGLTTNKNQE